MEKLIRTKWDDWGNAVFYFLGLPWIFLCSVKQYFTRDKIWCGEQKIGFKGILINELKLWNWAWEADD